MTPPRHLYLAGPATGLPDHNRAAFEQAAELLRDAGFRVTNPLERGADMPGWGWAQYLRRAIRQMLLCDAVALLPGWESSRGALVETALADTVEMAVQPVQFWLDRGPCAGASTEKEPA